MDIVTDNQKALRYTDPLGYLKAGAHDPAFALHALQKSFHVLLRRYLKTPERSFFRVAGREAEACAFYIAHMDPSRGAPAGTPAEFVCSVYAAMRALRPAHGSAATQERIIDIPYDIAARQAQHPRVRQYRLLGGLSRWARRNLEPYVSLFIVHGSYATDDYVDGWSDLDTALVLREEVLLSPALLRAARRKLSSAGLACYLFDPLAHHELMVFTPYDLEYYHDDTLPLAAYENGLLLMGERRMRVVRRDSGDERLHRLEWYARWYRGMAERDGFARTLYDWKNEIGTTLLIPALALEAKGTYVYKRESFALAKAAYPHVSWESVEHASALRAGWRVRSWVARLPLWLLLNGPADFTRRALMRLLRPVVSHSPRESREEIQRLGRSTLALMEDILSDALHHA